MSHMSVYLHFGIYFNNYDFSPDNIRKIMTRKRNRFSIFV